MSARRESRLVRGLLLAGACAALAGGNAEPARSTELLREGEATLSLSGSLRELAQIGAQTDPDAFVAAIASDFPNPRCFVAAQFEDCPAFGTVGERDGWQSLTRLRTRLDAELNENLRGVVVYDHELRTGVPIDAGSLLADGFRREDLFDGDWEIASGSRAEWDHLFYRGYVEVDFEPVDVTVGRQRIAWGVGRLWNPIDRFNAIPPLAVQADQSRGIDGIDARWSLDGFNFVEAVYAPGSSRGEARYALRFHGVVRDSDFSVVAGVFEKAGTVGVDFARNLGDAAFRLEAVYTRPRHKVWKIDAERRSRLDSFVQLVASLDYNFDVAGGIYALVEHLYNGNALGFGSGRAGALLPFFEATDAPNPFFGPGVYAAQGTTALFGSSRVISGAENQTGLTLGGDVTPELRADVLVIYDWNGQSAAFAPSLRYSPLGALEVSVGVQTFAGPRRSQYGSVDTIVYLLADVYF